MLCFQKLWLAAVFLSFTTKSRGLALLLPIMCVKTLVLIKCMPPTSSVTWSAGSHSLSRPKDGRMGISRQSGWVGLHLAYHLPKRRPSHHPWENGGGGSLPGTLTTASQPHPPCAAGRRMLQPRGRDRLPETPAPIGCRREPQRAIGRRGAGAGPGSCGGAAGRRRGCGRSPGSCCGGHGRPEPGAPRGRCGPQRGEEKEGFVGRSRASPLRAGWTHPHPRSGGVLPWAGTRTRPTREPQVRRQSLAGKTETILEASPSQGCSEVKLSARAGHIVGAHCGRVSG